MNKVPRIFNNKSLRINSTNQHFLKLQDLLIKTLQSRLDFFSRNFQLQVYHDFINLKVNENLIKIGFESLPFNHQTVDLAISAGPLMVTNDIPGVLKQWYACLKPGGVFMASFFGEETLKELNACFLKAEERLQLPHYLRFFPTVSTKDAGMLMQRADFYLPTADRTRHVFCVKNLHELFGVIKALGGNILYEKSSSFLTKKFLKQVEQEYIQHHSSETGLNVTVDIVCMTGWAIERYAEERIQQIKPKTLGYL